MSDAKPQPELLSPAGDLECLRAAVANGADAVYFGLEDFNARRRAANFTLADLPATVEYLHRHNVKGYVTFNTLTFSDELDRAAEFIRGAIEAGADALIVQDLGVMRLIRAMSPSFPIHASTQTTQTHPEGMAVLAELGVSRVILARELSIANISEIARRTSLELEVFVHGALCVSYSGQCLASEALWGRSGNRGMCAQACRLPYELVVDGQVRSSEDGGYLLSPHDLAAYDRVGELMRAGATAFKIEGRLKGPEYVAAVTGIYRAAIDAAVAGQPFSLSREQAEELAQSFSRGFTSGFLDGEQHQELIGLRSPKSRGVRIGTVVQRDRRGVIVQLDDDNAGTVKPGDGLVFDDGGAEEDEQGGRVYTVERVPGRSGLGGGQYLLTFGRDDLDPARVTIDAAVRKSDDPVVRRRIQSSYARDRVVRPVAVTARVTVGVGEPIQLVLRDANGNEAAAYSDEPLQKAERHPLTVAVLGEQLSRMGDTPFELKSVELIEGEQRVETASVLAPKSVLNELRRRAVLALAEVRERSSRHVVAGGNALTRLRWEAAAIASQRERAGATVHVLTRDPEQFAAVCEMAGAGAGLGTVYTEFGSESDKHTETATVARRHGVRWGVVTPQVLQLGDEDVLYAICEARPNAMLVRNLASLALVRRSLPEAELVGDFSLNVANELTAAVLSQAGLTRLTPGYDLNLSQLAMLAAAIPGVGLEIVVHAHVPMFHTAHCIAASGLSNGDNCRGCGHPCEHYTLHLRDRNREDHPVRTDATGRSTVFNGRAQTIAACRRTPTVTAWRDWRVELLDETPADACALVSLYLRWAAGDEKAATELRRWRPSYSGTLEF